MENKNGACAAVVRQQPIAGNAAHGPRLSHGPVRWMAVRYWAHLCSDRPANSPVQLLVLKHSVMVAREGEGRIKEMREKF